MGMKWNCMNIELKNNGISSSFVFQYQMCVYDVGLCSEFCFAERTKPSNLCFTLSLPVFMRQSLQTILSLRNTITGLTTFLVFVYLV